MKVYNINEITDSRLQYDKEPPPLMKYVILIVTALLISGIVWANNSVKTDVVKGNGIVVTADKSYIMNKASGEISEVFIHEGSEVKAGDVLFTTNSLETDIQLQQLNSQIEVYSKRVALLQRAEQNAANDTNNFNKNNKDETEFYNKLSAAYIARKEYDVDAESLRNQGYAEEQIDEFTKVQNNKRSQHYYETIDKFTSEKKQYELELSNLKSQKDALEQNKSQYVVTAQCDGTVHLSADLTSGMVLQAGTLIGTLNNKEEDLMIEVSLSSTDRPRIHIDDEVALAVSGLNQAEYGTIPGKVLSIDDDATINSENGNVYFKVKVKPDRTYMQDSKGEKVNLTLGMVAETRVKYEKITYMKYFLELIGVKFS